MLYPGWANRHVRKRLEQIAQPIRQTQVLMAVLAPKAARVAGTMESRSSC
jgi:hypothetical protein